MKCRLLLALAAAAAAGGCARSATAQRAGGGAAAVPVTVAEARLGSVSDRLDAVASVEPYETVSLKTQASGQIVAALTRRGLVRATADPADRRRARLKLTTEGRALARTLHPLAHEFRAAVEKDLSRREALELRRLLEKVIAGLDRYEDEGATS